MYMPGHLYALFRPVHSMLQVACRSKTAAEKAKREALRIAEPSLLASWITKEIKAKSILNILGIQDWEEKRLSQQTEETKNGTKGTVPPVPLAEGTVPPVPEMGGHKLGQQRTEK